MSRKLLACTVVHCLLVAACLAQEPSELSNSTPAVAPSQTQPAGPPIKDSIRSLWQENVQAPESGDNAELGKAVRELLSMEVRPKPKRTPRSASSPATASAPATSPAADSPTRRQVTPELAAKLLALAERSGDVAALADELYQAQQLDAAVVLYEAAIKSEPKADAGWLLLQLGNCRAAKDPAAAIALYQRVGADHAGSPWAPVASAQAARLAWSQSLSATLEAKAESASQPARQLSQNGAP